MNAVQIAERMLLLLLVIWKRTERQMVSKVQWQSGEKSKRLHPTFMLVLLVTDSVVCTV